MVEIELSVMVGAPGGSSHMLPLLETFKQGHRIQVNLTEVTWAAGWQEIVKFGIYGHGPDVSSIGTTWIGSLAAMQTLRPYTPLEVRALGGGEAFFDSIWQTGFLQNNPSLWAVPWLGDVLLLYFWEHLFKKAGISDYEAAFSTDEMFVDTLKRLQKSGVEYPLVINLKGDSFLLHEAAHWVWGAGGAFVSPDGRQVAFTQPEAIQGFRNYFNLRPYISPELLGTTMTGDLFNTAKSALHFAGPWMGSALRQYSDIGTPGIMSVPGATFAGGCSLVTWKHTLHPQESFDLVRFLTTQPVHPPVSKYDHQVPCRRSALQSPIMTEDPFHNAYLKGMERGKSFPTMRLWGAVEDKLRLGIGNIWADLFANPNQDLDTCIHKHLDTLAQRLNITLGN